DPVRTVGERDIQCPPPQESSGKCRQSTQLPLPAEDFRHRLIQVSIQTGLQLDERLLFRPLESRMEHPGFILMRSMRGQHRHIHPMLIDMRPWPRLVRLAKDRALCGDNSERLDE